jgi:amino acid transporter
VAAPLTIVAEVIAVALLGNTLAQFSRAHPSTGGFISFVGKSFGGTSAVTTALLCGIGYIIAISSVLAIVGGYLSIVLNYYFGWNVPWGILSVILTAGSMVMMVRGVSVSTRLAGLFFGFEMLVLIVVSIALIIKNGEPEPRAVRAEQPPQRFHRSRGRIPARRLPVHRLGELRRASRGNR